MEPSGRSLIVTRGESSQLRMFHVPLDGADEREQPSAERHGLSILIHTVLKSQAPDGSTAWPFQDSTCGPSA